MKKRLATGYTFDASAQTIVHADFSDITLAGIQLITNVTDQVIIYNFADSAKGGTLSTDTLTLEHDTTSMSDTDELMILVEDGVNTQTVSGTVTSELSAVDNAVLDTIDAVLDTIKVDTEAIETATEAIQAGQLADGHNVTIDNSTGAAAVNIQDGGNTITVDGTVTANLGAVDNAVLDQLELNQDSQTAILTTIDTDTGNIATAVQLIDDSIYADDADWTDDTSKHMLVGGLYQSEPQTITDGDVGPVQVDANGNVKVNITADESGLLTDINDSMTTLNTGITTIGTTEVRQVALFDNADTQITDFASKAKQDTIIGHLDGVETVLGTIDADTSALAGAVSGTEVQTDVLSVLPGTAATNLGKAEDAAHTTGDTGVFALGVRNDTMADTSTTDADYSQVSTDLKGRVITTNAPRARKLHQITTITASTSETTILTAAASTFHDVYGIMVTNTSATATEIHVKDDTAGTTRFTLSCPANDTRGFMLPIDAAINASATNDNWTATAADSVSSLIITVFAVKNL